MYYCVFDLSNVRQVYVTYFKRPKEKKEQETHNATYYIVYTV